MLDYSFQTLHADAGDLVIFRGVTGSRAYGTNRPGSDEDIRGVFLVPPVEYALLCAPPPQVADKSIGMLFFNESAFAQAKRAHRQYWEWRRTRNDARWVSQEAGQLDYDAKNMMHLVRLLLSGRNIVRHGEPIVRFEGAERDRLLSIRDGAWSFDDIMALADSLQADIRSEIDTCPLPVEPDLPAIDNLLRELQP